MMMVIISNIHDIIIIWWGREEIEKVICDITLYNNRTVSFILWYNIK